MKPPADEAVITLNVNLTIPGFLELFGDIRDRLRRLEAQGRASMKTQQEILDQIKQIDDATTAEGEAIAEQTKAIDGVGTKLQELKDQIAAGGDLSAIGAALEATISTIGNTKTALEASTSRLTAMAADPENPVPQPA